MVRKRLLVVEDEEKIRHLLKDALEPDYEVTLARDGREGLALAREARPDLILLDLHLPRIDGYNVLRALKMSVETIEIPVIVVSAVSAADSLLQANVLGACEYLIKPLELDELRRAVHRGLLSCRRVDRRFKRAPESKTESAS